MTKYSTELKKTKCWLFVLMSTIAIVACACGVQNSGIGKSQTYTELQNSVGTKQVDCNDVASSQHFDRATSQVDTWEDFAIYSEIIRPCGFDGVFGQSYEEILERLVTSRNLPLVEICNKRVRRILLENRDVVADADVKSCLEFIENQCGICGSPDSCKHREDFIVCEMSPV